MGKIRNKDTKNVTCGCFSCVFLLRNSKKKCNRHSIFTNCHNISQESCENLLSSVGSEKIRRLTTQSFYQEYDYNF